MSGGVILYDGECGFCSRGVQLVFRRDPKARYRFASLQSETGRRLLREHGLPDAVATVALIQDGRAFVRSTAALRIGLRLRWPWSWLAALGLVVPRPIRDAAYDLVAKNRHRIAGESCLVPTSELRARMLE